ncbi:MAG: nucleotidyl transferase AbiEii/AbiGii toxin family protein [Chloroflexia bacterium]|nr:nucleotidyl transferase AbiEii/AbiGii toxin family protein [Chloroflexia bacterium]
MTGRYGSPQAFRHALENRLRRRAERQGVDLQRLRRRVAFERLLARLFAPEQPPWLLKGGYALELRLQDRARSTLDLDLAVPEERALEVLAPHQAENAAGLGVYELLQEAAAREMGDGFRFYLSRPKEERSGAPGGGLRCSVEAHLAGRVFAQFHLDVGLGDAVLEQPDWVEGHALLDFADIDPARVALYPPAQHFAEKLHAYTFPWPDRENTRVKDLLDLVLLLHLGGLRPEQVRPALRATFAARRTHPLPRELPAPPESWSAAYAAQARELELPAATLPDAYAYLQDCWQRWGLERLAQDMERNDEHPPAGSAL